MRADAAGSVTQPMRPCRRTGAGALTSARRRCRAPPSGAIRTSEVGKCRGRRAGGVAKNSARWGAVRTRRSVAEGLTLSLEAEGLLARPVPALCRRRAGGKIATSCDCIANAFTNGYRDETLRALGQQLGPVVGIESEFVAERSDAGRACADVETGRSTRFARLELQYRSEYLQAERAGWRQRQRTRRRDDEDAPPNRAAILLSLLDLVAVAAALGTVDALDDVAEALLACELSVCVRQRPRSAHSCSPTST